MNPVKRQHYVWRAYLRAWSSNEVIWTYFKEFNRVERTNLMGVAQERYFYELVDFTEEEEAFLVGLVDKMSPAVIKPLTQDYLTLFTSTGKLKRSLNATTNPSTDREKVAQEIREMEINTMEIAHGKIESMGTRLISVRTLEQLKTIEDDEYILDAVMFLCFQYFRTKNMKKSALRGFAGGQYEELANKAWNILSYTMATVLARNISLEPKLRFIIHENTSAENFLTSDQPIFNILSDDLDETGEVKSLELYYPLSPRQALTLHFRQDQIEKFVANNADADFVSFVNAKVVKNADFAVFSNAKDHLETLVK